MGSMIKLKELLNTEYLQLLISQSTVVYTLYIGMYKVLAIMPAHLNIPICTFTFSVKVLL